MIFESGKACCRNWTVDSDGGQYALPGRTNWLDLACNGGVQIYFTQADFDNDTNGRQVLGASDSQDGFSGPYAVDNLWLRSVGGAQVNVTVMCTIQV